MLRLVALIGLATLSSASCAETNRIAAVENGLRGPVAVAGEPVVTSSIKERMEHFHVPGVSIAVVDGGRIAWAKGYGEASAGQTVTPTTRFQAGSISKAVTAVAAMKLVDSRRLALDSDVNTILRNWKLPGTQTVTLRQLLSHSAGVGVHAFYPGYEPGAPLPTPVQILDGRPPAVNPPIRVEAPPGKAFDYSGGGYQVVQQILTDVSGRPFAEFIRSSIFKPLGMASSSFVQVTPATAGRNRSTGHDREGAELPNKWFLHPEMAAAGLWSTPSDLARMGIAVSSALNGRRNSLLSPPGSREMLTPQVGGWGLGFALEGSGRTLRFRHGGDNPGFKAVMLFYPALGQGAVVMTNGDRGDRLADEILFSIAAAYSWPDFGPKTKVRASVTAAELSRVAGTYTLDNVPNARMIIAPRGEGLSMTLVQSTGESTTELLPAGNGRFFRRDIDFELQFDEGAPPRRATIIQDGDSYPATRAEPAGQ